MLLQRILYQEEIEEKENEDYRLQRKYKTWLCYHNSDSQKKDLPMRVNVYNTLLDDQGLSFLIKEKSFNYPQFQKLNTAEIITKFMNDAFLMDKHDTEYVYMLCMDTKCHLIGIFEVSHGTVNLSLVSTREIIIKALLSNSVNIVIIHNHPSHCYEPSSQDIAITKKIQAAFKLVDLTLVDHIIISTNGYFSFSAEKML